MVNPNKVRLAVWVPREVYDALDDLVERRGTSKSEVVTRALTAVLANEGAEERLMRVSPRIDLLEQRPRRHPRKP